MTGNVMASPSPRTLAADEAFWAIVGTEAPEWNEWSSPKEDGRPVVVVVPVRLVSRPMPFQLIRRYADVAARRAEIEQTEDGEFVATIPGFQGVWAAADDEVAARSELQSVVYDWAILKRRQGDDDLPVIEGIDLNL